MPAALRTRSSIFVTSGFHRMLRTSQQGYTAPGKWATPFFGEGGRDRVPGVDDYGRGQQRALSDQDRGSSGHRSSRFQ